MGEQASECYAHCHFGAYRDFFPHQDIVRSIGGNDPIHRVRITTDADGSFWSWWNAEKSRHDFTWSHRDGVEICFPYGSKAEEDRGRGKVVRVRVERIEEAAG